MAKFGRALWEAGDESVAQLEVATALWLRTLGTPLDDQLGLSNMIRLLVAPTNSLYWAEGIPKLVVTVVSTGQVLERIGAANMLWTSETNALHRRLTLEYLKHVSYEVRINLSWLEYALAKAMASLYNSRIDWASKLAKKNITIGGIEKVDWL